MNNLLSKLINEDKNLSDEELRKFIKVIKESGKLELIENILNNVKEEYFIQDEIHGITHNERVVILACYIGIKEGLSDEELRLVLEAAKYHDIGRGYEGNHGMMSATIIERNRNHIFPYLRDEEIRILQALCHGHSVDDKKYLEIAGLYGIQDVQKFKKLLDTVKDADALDRVRLPRFGNLDEKYLRTETSKTIVDIAQELYREHEKIRNELLNEKTTETVEESNYVLDNELRSRLLFDGENYYLVRSLNKDDIENINNRRGIIPKKDSTSEFTVQDVMAQIRMQHRKTNLISMSEDPNVVLTYDRANLHRYVLIKISKDEIEDSKKVFSAGEYLLGVMDYQIEKIAKNAPDNVRAILERIDNANSIEEIIRIINGADRQVKTSLVEVEQQYLSAAEQLEQSKKIAKCKILNYYGLMRNITHDEKGSLLDISGFTQIMRLGFSSSEWLHSGKIEQENIINVPQMLVDSLALVRQAEFQGKDKEALNKIEQEIIKLALSGSKVKQDGYQLEYITHENLKRDLTIDKAYELTEGEISYRDTYMQMTAIRLIAEMTYNKRKIIELLQERMPEINVEELLKDTTCVNQELVTRQNNRGNQFTKNISFIISDYGYDLDDEVSMGILEKVNNLNNEQLASIILNGINAPEIKDILIKTRESEERIQSYKSKTLSSKYIAEAMVEGYNWKKEGNALTKKEKNLLANLLLRSVTNNNELYKLYDAINKTQIGRKKFTQNEIFAIMINLAIDRKIGDVPYSELIKKEKKEIQLTLLNNSESIQTSVLPISIDLLAGRGREINKLIQELTDLGIEEEFVKSKDIKNVYMAKKIVEGYNYGREISDEEKKALIKAVLSNSALDNKQSVYLTKLMQKMEEIGLQEQERYGMIINLGVNGKVIEQIGYGYSGLLQNSKDACQTIEKYKNDIQTQVTEETIQKAVVENGLIYEEEKNLIQELTDLGIEEEFVKSKDIKNVYMARKIVEGYKYGREISGEEKKVLIKAVLSNSVLDKKACCYYLTTLLQKMEEIGLEEQKRYGMIINLAVNRKVIKQGGYSYTNLLMNQNNACQTIAQYKDEIQTQVTEKTIKKAIIQSKGEYQIDLLQEEKNLIQELTDLGIEEEFIKSKDIKNVYMAKKIVEGYDYEREISNEERKSLIKVLLNNSCLDNKKSIYLTKLMQKMEEIGLEEQEIYGMIINLGVNGNVTKQSGYSYKNLLTNSENACQTIAKYKEEIQTKVTEETIQKAIIQSKGEYQIDLTQKEGKNLIQELTKLGIEEEFVKSKDIKNVYMAKKIVEGYNYGREISEGEKNVLIKAVLNNSWLDNRPFLTTLMQKMEEIGLEEQKIYGMIINLGVNGKVIEQTGYGYGNLLMNRNNACQTIAKYKEEIQTKVTEETIQKAIIQSKGEYQIDLTQKEGKNLIQELTKLGIEEELIKNRDIRNVYMAKKIVEGYKYGREISDEEKKALIKAVLSNSVLDKKAYRYYLTTLMQKMEKIGLEEQEIYGMIIYLGVNGKVIEQSGYGYQSLLTNNNNACQTIAKYKGDIQTKVTEETIQKAIKKANKLRNVTGQNLAQASVELTAEGSGGSTVCNDVKTDYQRLMIEKTKENEKEGSEQGEPN